MRTPANRLWEIALVSCAVACWTGCSTEVIEVPAPAKGTGGGGPPEPAPPVAAAPRSSTPPAGLAGGAPPRPAAEEGPTMTNAPPVLASDPDEKGPDALGATLPAENSEEAVAGVGAQGRGYGGGLVTEPIRQKFNIEQRLVFQMQIPEAMKAYKALHDNQAPKTHEVFMREIVEANGIALPKLPEGDQYQYVPKSEKLMVRHRSK